LKSNKESTDVSSSHKIMPKLYTSLASVYADSSANISGAVQYNDPEKHPITGIRAIIL
jgi:hypothetical protein